ncbi:MAG: DUF1553 domain-containing protein [Bacteroidales bacterium]|nr:DUF1553 domain-containing protein [Bacteroidales bacterium]
MLQRLQWLVCVLFVCAGPLHAEDLYSTQIKPLMTARCIACHGALQQKGGLRLDTAAQILASDVVVPGKSGESVILNHLRGDPDYARMPPASEGEVFSKAQIELVKRWIDSGAKAPSDETADPDPRDHWAFRAPQRPPVPPISSPKFVIQNPVDAFLAQQWQERGLTPNPPADPRLLVRRVYLDLIGLPPTPEETAAFLADRSPDALEKLVDRLLASPQYGERWGRHFMDIWRYSDWWGLGAQVRHSQKHMWHWRDWIIENLNNDTGYDEMIRQMFAADELYPNDLDKLRATGFLARQYFLFNRTSWMDEAIEHTGKAFLGLTINCAKCHDHKYDPISQTDYYRLRAFFEPYQIRMEMVPGEVNFEKDGIPRAYDCHPDAVTYKHRRGDDRQPIKDVTITPGVPGLLEYQELVIAEVKLPNEAHSPHLRAFVLQNYLKSAQAQGEFAVAAVRARAHADQLKVTGTPEQYRKAAQAAAAAEKRLALSQAEQACQQAEATLAQAQKAQESQPKNDKAQAATQKKRDDAQKALNAAQKALETARKAAHNPGEKYTPLRGAIKSQEAPTESIPAAQAATFPKISTGRRTAFARWLADRRNPLTARVLVNHVWARHFGRPFVATLFDFGRKGAAPTHPQLLDWLAVELMEHNWSIKHLHKTILTSHAYRMSSTNAGAEANLQRDGENQMCWRQNPIRMESQAIRDGLLRLAGTLDLTMGGPSIPLNQQDSSHRRGLYFVHSHNDHHKFLSQFDDANVLDCYRRAESIVPQQALTLANSQFALQMADVITARLLTQAHPSTDEQFIQAAFRLLLATDPTPAEQSACAAALNTWRKTLKTSKHANPNRKAQTNLVAALLNHNDFVTIR